MFNPKDIIKGLSILALTVLLILALCGTIFGENRPYRKEITIDHTKIAANLTNFPVLINFSSDPDLAIKAQEDGDDIVFTSDDGSTKLDHEMESYDSLTGNLVVWVRIPNLSPATNTVIYMYYGDPAAGPQENPTGVWDSNYVMVQHLAETFGTHEDSTPNNNDGISYNLASQDVTGRIDGADEFDATGDLIDVGMDSSLDVFDPNEDFSIFLWIKRDTTTAVEGFFSSGSSMNNGIFFGSGYPNRGELRFLSKDNTVSIISTNGAIGDNNWHYVGVTADRNGDMTFWVDGVSVHSESIASHSGEDWNREDDTYKIGTDRSENYPFDGIIDEVRLLNIVRTEGWISTSFNNQTDPSSFYLIGSEEGAF